MDWWFSRVQDGILRYKIKSPYLHIVIMIMIDKNLHERYLHNPESVEEANND